MGAELEVESEPGADASVVAGPAVVVAAAALVDSTTRIAIVISPWMPRPDFKATLPDSGSGVSRGSELGL